MYIVDYEACTRTRTVPYCTVLYFSFIVSLYVSDLCNVTKYHITMNHIFQKNAIELETGISRDRITRHETIRHDSVCDVIYFRLLIDNFD